MHVYRAPVFFSNLDLRFCSFQCYRLSPCLIAHPASHLCNHFVPGIYFALQKATPLPGPQLCRLKALLLSRIWSCAVICVASTHWLVVLSCSGALAHLLEPPHVVKMLQLTVTVQHFAAEFGWSWSLTSSGVSACRQFWVYFVPFFQYLQLRFLLPPEYNGSEWTFVCGAHSIKKLHLKKSTANCLSRISVLVTLDNSQFSFEGLSTKQKISMKTELIELTACSAD